MLSSIVNYLTYLWTKTPWREAYILLAFSKYIECDVFRERLAAMGPKYCVEQYMDHDYWFWKRRITRKEMWEILLKPYAVIKRAKEPISFFSRMSDLTLTKVQS